VNEFGWLRLPFYYLFLMRMRCWLIYCMFLLFVFGSVDLNAQVFRGGMKGGLTASEVSGDDAGGPDKLGWFAAVYTNMDLRPHLRLQLELMYIQKGSRAFYDPWDEDPESMNKHILSNTAFAFDDPIEPDPSGYRDYRFYMHYVEIPLLVQFDFSPITRLPYVELMSAEFGLSGSRVVGHYEENNGMEVTDTMNTLRPFRAAELNVLAGLYLPITDGLHFHMRFSQGVTPLRTRYSKEEIVCAHALECYRKRHQFNTVWSFGFSYTFFIRG